MKVTLRVVRATSTQCMNRGCRKRVITRVSQSILSDSSAFQQSKVDLLAYLTDQRLARKVHRVSGSPLLCIEEINFSYVSVLTVHVVVHIPRGALVIWNISIISLVL